MKILIFYLFNINIFFQMTNDYKIMSTSNLLDYLESKSRKPMSLDYQLNSNYANIYLLENDEVVLIPSTFQGDGILFKNSKSFENMVGTEIFPIENPNRGLFELEMKSILNIKNNTNISQEQLNHGFKLNYMTVDRNTLKSYYQNVKSIFKNRADKNKYLIALTTLVGEYLKETKQGHWALIKRYGIYNPYYEPVIITPDDKIIFFSDRLFGMLESNINDFDLYFRYQSIEEPKTNLIDYIKAGNKVIKL